MSICITSYIVWIKQLQDKLKRSWSVYSTSVNIRGKYMPFFAPPSIQLIFVQFFVTYTKVDLFLNSCNSWIELKWEWLETKKFCADLWKTFWWKDTVCKRDCRVRALNSEEKWKGQSSRPWRLVSQIHPGLTEWRGASHNSRKLFQKTALRMFCRSFVLQMKKLRLGLNDTRKVTQVESGS